MRVSRFIETCAFVFIALICKSLQETIDDGPPHHSPDDRIGFRVRHCRAFFNKKGYCIRLSSCPSLTQTLKNSPAHVAIWLIRGSVCGFSSPTSEPLVCCPERPQSSKFRPLRPYRQRSKRKHTFNSHRRRRPTPASPEKDETTTESPIILQDENTSTTTAIPKRKVIKVVVVSTEPPRIPSEPEKVLVPQPTSELVTSAPIVSVLPSDDLQTGCGFSNASLIKMRIMGGKEAKIGAWPWISALGYLDPSENGSINFLCGGALISSQYILTAGHCVHERDDLKSVRLGDHDLTSDADNTSPVDIDVDQVILHPNYNPSTFQNDIAILRLRNPVAYTMEVHPICLPTAPGLRNNHFTNTTPYVAGWGAVQFNGPTSSKLQEVQVPVVEVSVCQDKFKAFQQVHIDDSIICAGYQAGGKDACQGDSGGPLMLTVRNFNFVIIGVVSLGFNCGEPGFPGIYTRVTSHLDWITNAITGTP